jgi:hypothetical protein
MYNSASKEIVIDASNEHYDVLYESISNLIVNQPDIDLTLTIKFRGVSVELNINDVNLKSYKVESLSSI